MNVPHWLRIIEVPLCLDVFVVPKRHEKLLVCGQDALIDGRTELPYFYRSKWTRHFPCTFLTFNDPTLYFDRSLRSGYFQAPGSLDLVWRVIKQIASELSINLDNLVLYGSSAGGYWVLQSASEFAQAKLVIDIPQVDLNSYLSESQKSVMSTTFGLGMNYKYPFAFDYWDENQLPRNLLYLQNLDDVRHTRIHYSAFFKHISELAVRNKFIGDLRSMFYQVPDASRGHTPLPEDKTVTIINQLI